MVVYLIKNLINGKMYVGQTVNFKDRKRQHLSVNNRENDRLYNHPLYVEMREYGNENFEFSILEECSSKEECDEKEDYYIRKLETIIDSGKGYNLNYGGENGLHSEHTKSKLPLFQSGENNISFGKKNGEAYASKRVINFTTQTIYDSLRDCAIKEYGDIAYVKPISNVCDPNSNKFTYNGNVYYILNDKGEPVLKNAKPIKNVGSKGVKVIEEYSGKVFDSINEVSAYFNISTGMVRDRIYNRIKNDKYKEKFSFKIYT